MILIPLADGVYMPLLHTLIHTLMRFRFGNMSATACEAHLSQVLKPLAVVEISAALQFGNNSVSAHLVVCTPIFALKRWGSIIVNGRLKLGGAASPMKHAG